MSRNSSEARMVRYSFLVVNGPNLGRLGQRQPDVYGSRTMDDLPEMLLAVLGEGEREIDLELFQSNSEGGLIDRLEAAHDGKCDGVVLNAGAYTHTSLALADCLAWIDVPTVEVHLSNVLARSSLRHESLIGKHCLGVVAGFGLMSYALGVAALYQHLRARDL